MKRGVIFFAMMLSGAVARGQTAKEFVSWMEEAQGATRFEDRVRTHERALDAILKADMVKLEAALVLWCKDEEREMRNEFVGLAWTRLAQMDEARALRVMENAPRGDPFSEAAKRVWAVIAAKDPERACKVVKGFEDKWLAWDVMRAVGAAWFRKKGLATLKRLPELSEYMATAVFHGCVSEAKTAEEKLALLDRYAGDEKPVIEENHTKSPNLCEELVRAAALADLSGTRAWVERRFPLGTKALNGHKRDYHVVHARDELFRVWAGLSPTAAAEWLMAQQPAGAESDVRSEMIMAVFAIAGPDRKNMAAALEWVGKQTRREERIATLAELLDDERGEDAVWRQSREVLAHWLAGRPVAEREAVVLKSAQDFIHLQNKENFLAIIFPESAKCREMIERIEKITSPQLDPEVLSGSSFMLRVFDLPIRDKALVVSEADAGRCRELAGLHEMARTSIDPLRRREGLEALKWMKAATPAELRPVLLAYLKDHRMDWFSQDLLSAWVLQDWRACEAFAMGAPFPVAQRDDMLIHIFCEAAELHPDATLARLRELMQSKVLVQAALDGPTNFSRVRWMTYYYGTMITRSLARGLLSRGDMHALATIQTLPPRWQHTPFDELYRSFTTPACGLALLAHLEEAEQVERKQGNDGGIFRSRSYQMPQVIERLASISPKDAVQWIEGRPERFKNFEEGVPFDDVWHLHEGWSRIDAKAADAWMERMRREHPLRKPEPPVSTGPSDSRRAMPLLDAVPPSSR
ncbi:hypothetical protein [Prosthecobacter sp.]|uniref:hypothetical protein n=1 Tax=Prosthecobacter sp. TaxID=1965333 RepID=UPI0037835585